MNDIFVGIRKFFRLFFYFNFRGRFIIYPFVWMKKSCQFSVSCLNFSRNICRGYLWDFEYIWKWSMRLFRRIWRKWNMWIIWRISFCIGRVLILISILNLFFCVKSYSKSWSSKLFINLDQINSSYAIYRQVLRYL